MDRYAKYFLDSILWLEDDFCSYYLQNDFWGRKEILDVESVVFDWKEEVEQWLIQCAEFDHYNTYARLRRFLADDCLTNFQVHRMDNRKVIRAAADQINKQFLQLVIEPKFGWAVEIDEQFNQPAVPISVEPAADLDAMLAELKAELDALVAEQ